MKYREGFKYQLEEVETIEVPELQGFPEYYDRETGVSFAACRLTIGRRFVWDGASGPTVDTDNSMLPSLVHDATAQISRRSPEWTQAQRKRWVKGSNQVFYRLLREGSDITPPMSRWRAKLWVWGVSRVNSYADPSSRKKVHEV